MARPQPLKNGNGHGIEYVLLLSLLTLSPASASAPAGRIFPYQQAEQARQLARRECKPLVVHFIPDSPVGAEQLNVFYSGPNRIPPSVLEDVVIVVAPMERYAGFARELGLSTPGGCRSLSAYDLSTLEEPGVATCRVGFR